MTYRILEMNRLHFAKSGLGLKMLWGAPSLRMYIDKKLYGVLLTFSFWRSNALNTTRGPLFQALTQRDPTHASLCFKRQSAMPLAIGQMQKMRDASADQRRSGVTLTTPCNKALYCGPIRKPHYESNPPWKFGNNPSRYLGSPWSRGHSFLLGLPSALNILNNTPIIAPPLPPLAG